MRSVRLANRFAGMRIEWAYPIFIPQLPQQLPYHLRYENGDGQHARPHPVYAGFVFMLLFDYSAPLTDAYRIAYWKPQ